MNQVTEHYEREGLLETVLNSLGEAGIDVDALQLDDLAPLDEFHIGGRNATREMIDLAAIGPDDRVLDVGAGIGGPARAIAAATGARVTGVDLTDAYCRVATNLTHRLGMDDRVKFRQADALDLPFGAGSFDVVWTQHMTMNVADKDRLYAELARMLRPGGRLICYEVVAGGNAGALHYPVPWADSAAINFLDSEQAMRERFADAGLSITRWLDRTDAGQAFFRRMMARGTASGPARLGLHVLAGPDMKEKTRNLLRNLEEHRVGVVLVLAQCEFPGGNAAG